MNLDDLRRQVDEIDSALVELLARRAQTAQQIGAEKRRQGAAIHDPDREDAVLQHVLSLNRGPLQAEDLTRLFRDIMAACTRVQEQRPAAQP